MHPVLLKLGPLTLYSYGAMLVLASAVAIGVAVHAARRAPSASIEAPPEQIADCLCSALLGGIVGGRLFYILLNWELFTQAPWEIIALWHGGLVWYGGFLGGVAGAWLYLRAKRRAFLRALDQLIPFVALGHAIGRIGCFLNGCCYGKPTTSWCGVLFPGRHETVLPTQLFEAAGLCLLYLVLRWLQRPGRRTAPGGIVGAYLILYGLLRFLLEFARGDQTIWWAGLTVQQVLSLGVMVVGLMLVFRVSSFAFRVGKTRETQDSSLDTH